jgi:hypothetical protein
MSNPNPRDARTYYPAPTLWKYDPQANILWAKLTDASSNTTWFPIRLTSSPSQSTTPAQSDHARQGLRRRMPIWVRLDHRELERWTRIDFERGAAFQRGER